MGIVDVRVGSWDVAICCALLQTLCVHVSHLFSSSKGRRPRPLQSEPTHIVHLRTPAHLQYWLWQPRTDKVWSDLGSLADLASQRTSWDSDMELNDTNCFVTTTDIFNGKATRVFTSLKVNTISYNQFNPNCCRMIYLHVSTQPVDRQSMIVGLLPRVSHSLRLKHINLATRDTIITIIRIWNQRM